MTAYSIIIDYTSYFHPPIMYLWSQLHTPSKITTIDHHWLLSSRITSLLFTMMSDPHCHWSPTLITIIPDHHHWSPSLINIIPDYHHWSPSSITIITDHHHWSPSLSLSLLIIIISTSCYFTDKEKQEKKRSKHRSDKLLQKSANTDK